MGVFYLRKADICYPEFYQEQISEGIAPDFKNRLLTRQITILTSIVF
jgi:hypothetical protein